MYFLGMRSDITLHLKEQPNYPLCLMIAFLNQCIRSNLKMNHSNMALNIRIQFGILSYGKKEKETFRIYLQQQQ